MTEMTCASYNLRVGRHADVVVHQVATFLRAHDVDVMTVCEAAGYVDHLADELVGYSVHAYLKRDGSARDSAVIVRDGLAVKRKRLHRLERAGWERGKGRPGLHWPRSAVSVEVEGVRVMAVHLPPGPFRGRFYRRGIAFDASVRKLAKVGRRWSRHPFVWAGDWNQHEHAMSTGTATSPAWLAEQVGAHIHGDGIDYVMAHGVRVSGYQRVRFGTSDHDPILYLATCA